MPSPGPLKTSTHSHQVMTFVLGEPVLSRIDWDHPAHRAESFLISSIHEIIHFTQQQLPGQAGRVSLSELRKLVMDREAWRAANSWGCKESKMTERLN